MNINKFLLILCALPFFHTVSCLGQNKKVPAVSQVGTIGFVVTCMTGTSLSGRDEKLKQKLKQSQREFYYS